MNLYIVYHSCVNTEAPDPTPHILGATHDRSLALNLYKQGVTKELEELQDLLDEGDYLAVHKVHDSLTRYNYGTVFGAFGILEGEGARVTKEGEYD